MDQIQVTENRQDPSSDKYSEPDADGDSVDYRPRRPKAERCYDCAGRQSYTEQPDRSSPVMPPSPDRRSKYACTVQASGRS